MSVFLITYDLNKETVRPNIVKTIQNDFTNWAQLSESSYAVVSNLAADDVYIKVAKHLDENDQCYVITLAKPFGGFGPKVVNDWLQENLS